MSKAPILLIGIIAALLIICSLILALGYETTWRYLQINPILPIFADTHCLTSGAESAANGYDPFINNPSDPLGRRLNYPRIWHTLHYLGIDNSHAFIIGIFQIIAFLVGLFLFLPNKVDSATQLLILFAILSPAILLGVERGNTDLSIFFLIAASLYFINQQAVIFSLLMFLLAFMLKIFPIFGFTMFLKVSKKTVIRILCVIAIFCIGYLLLINKDLRLIRNATPITLRGTYGINLFWKPSSDEISSFEFVFQIMTYPLLILGSYLTIYYKPWLNELKEFQYGSSINAFRAGGSIYIGTFLMNTNYIYRFIFLIFTLPLLLNWARDRNLPGSKQAKMALCSIIIALYGNLFLGLARGYLYLKIAVYAFLKLSHWVILFSLAFLVLSSLPDWFREKLSISCIKLRQACFRIGSH